MINDLKVRLKIQAVPGAFKRCLAGLRGRIGNHDRPLSAGLQRGSQACDERGAALSTGTAGHRDHSRSLGDRLLDIGTGAGLPGLPLAILEPARRFTLLDGEEEAQG